MKTLVSHLLMLMISTFTYGDPCTEYNPIADIHRRDSAYQLSYGEEPINDRELAEDWYGEMTFKLLDEAPGFFKCGGFFPMWRSDSDGVRATICVQDHSCPCCESFEIDMKTCDDGNEVYLLSEAPIHRASYCFVNNPIAPPMFNVTPSISVDLKHEELVSKLLFRCNFPPSDKDLFYKTIWYVEGAPVHTFEPAQWSEDYITDTTLTEDILMDNGFKAGINIQCAVRAQFSLEGALSESELSENKFVGVKVSYWDHSELDQGETRNLQMSMTVPFGCGTWFQTFGHECKFNVEVVTLGKPEDCTSAAVIQGPCGIKPFVSESWSQSSYITFVGRVTSTYGHTSGTSHLKLKTPQNVGDFLSKFWEDYDIGHVTVKVNKNTSLLRYKYCSIRNDPYLYTFDSRLPGNRRHVVNIGVFTLYQDESKNIEVQVETEICNPQRWLRTNPTCTCGIVVRAGRTVFEISHCDTPVWHIGYMACEDGGDVMIVRRMGTLYYEITLPTGTLIEVYVKTDDTQFLNVDLNPTPLDKGKSRGLCGVLSENAEDDMTMKNGDIADNSEEFIGSWRIPKEDSLFNPDVIENGLTSFKPVYQYCTCDESTPDKQITCSAMAASEVCHNPGGIKIEPRNCTIAKRKKRMAQPKLRFKRASTEYTWHNGWNESAATAYCESKFAESPSVQLVKVVPGVDVDSPKSDCVADIKASGTIVFTSASVSSVAIQASREAMVNPVLSEPDPDNPSAPTLYDVITQQTCPGDCSERGTCSAGTCQCDTGYEGGDCSIDITMPPQLVEIADGGHCDLAVKECLQVEVLGDVFSGDKDSQCLIERQMVQPSGEKTKLLNSSSRSTFESISEVFCVLPELSEDDVVVSINISVSHSGDIYSNELSVFVYDSSCVNVDHSTGAWTLQGGFCVYKGRCTPVGSLREDNTSVKCVENEEGPSWERTFNPCADYKPIPDIDRRDAAYELSAGEEPINDRELVDGWYGNMTYKLLDEAPGFFKCGGFYPMWLSVSNGVTATICVQGYSDECQGTFEIEMKTCGGYEVYLLPEAPVHRASYCFENV